RSPLQLRTHAAAARGGEQVMSEAKNVAPRADALVEAFKALDTASVSDAMDKLGLPAGCLGITPVVTGVKFAGRAFTVKYRVCGAVERGTVGDFLDDVPAGQVVVIDNG